MTQTKLVVLALVSLAAGTYGQNYLPSFAHLNHLGPGGHARGGGEQAEARAKRGNAQFDDVGVNVSDIDNTPHGDSGADDGEESHRFRRHLEIGGKVGGTFKIGIVGHGFGGENEEADRFKRETSDYLNDIKLDVNAVDNSRHGAGAADEDEEEDRLKREAHPLRRPRLTRETSDRLGDINVNVDAVDNSHHTAIGEGNGEEAERLKRQADRLRHLEIGEELGGMLKIGFTGHGHGGDSGQDNRLKRQAPTRLDDINIDIRAEDNSVHA